MPRLPRYFAPDQPQHVVLRGNDRQDVFRQGRDFAFFRNCVADAAREFGVAIHAYVWMSNHVHLLVTPAKQCSIARAVQAVSRRYVPYFNRTYGRTGALWEGRYRATIVDSERYLFACMRYIEENPVRAGMVASPERYRWSSFRRNAWGRDGPDLDWISPHPLYAALGRADDERQAAYRALFDHSIPDDDLAAIRETLHGGWALGASEFRREIAAQTGRRSEPLPRGRPPRRAGPAQSNR